MRHLTLIVFFTTLSLGQDTGDFRLYDVVLDFGAVANSSAAASTNCVAFNTALSQASRAVYVPPGVYWMGCSVSPTGRTTLFGAGYMSKLKAAFSGGAIININNTTRVTVRDLALDGNRSAVPSAQLHGLRTAGGDEHRIENLWVEEIPGAGSFGDGIILGDSTDTTATNVGISNVYVSKAQRNGISILKVNGVTIDQFHIRDVSGSSPETGINIEPHGEQFARNVVISNGNISRVAVGVQLEGDTTTGPNAQDVTISAVTIAETRDSGVRLHGARVSIVGCTIKDTNSVVASRGAVHIFGTTSFPSSDITLSGNTISRSGGFGVMLVTPLRGVAISGNTISYSANSGIFLQPSGAAGTHHHGISITANVISNNHNGTSNQSGILLQDQPNMLIYQLSIQSNIIADWRIPPLQNYGIDAVGVFNSDRLTWLIQNNILLPEATAATRGL